MFEHLTLRDRWTYVAIAAMLVFGITWTLAKKFQPVGPAEIHGIPASTISANPTTSSENGHLLVPNSSSSDEPSADGRLKQSLSDVMPTPSSAPNEPALATEKPDKAPATVTGSGLDWLNSASVEQLQDLPGVGPSLAQRIEDYRKAQGPFTSIEGLLQVKGIGAKRLERIRGFLADK